MRDCENLQPSEWEELAALPTVRELWNLEPGEDGEALSGGAYGAKFPSYLADSFNYRGDLIILQGDDLERPLQFFRPADGKLKVILRAESHFRVT